MSQIAITFHGHSTFSIAVDGIKIVIDPYFAPHNSMALVKEAAVSADVILISHGHGDHITDAVALATRTGAKVIANAEIADWLYSQGVTNLHPQHIGGGFQHDFGHVKMTPALHGSALPDGSNGGNPGGFLLTLAGKKIYYAGDTGLFSDMALIGAHDIDLAILPIGDNYTMGPDDALLALGYLTPRNVVPCHYGMSPLIDVDADAWVERVSNETTANPIKMSVEDIFTLG